MRAILKLIVKVIVGRNQRELSDKECIVKHSRIENNMVKWD